MNFVISLLPIALYFALIKGFDGFSLAKWHRLVECLLWGVFSCFACFILGKLCNFNTKFIFPLIEEYVKCLPLIVTVHRNRSAFLSETILYGSATGAGFAFLENILYIVFNDNFLLGDAFLRGFGTALLHMGCTALFACTILTVSRVFRKSPLPVKLSLSVFAVIPAYTIHMLYNLFLLPEFIQMIIAVIVIIALIAEIYNIDNKLIHKWLDLCINNDVSLIKAIREGNLSSTNAGLYLMLAKEKFQPEVFFDICVYLGLYLEVSIAAKSRMIMKEAGFEIPMTEKEHQENLSKIRELANLKKMIGPSGILFLSPLVNSKAVDEWAMTELL